MLFENSYFWLILIGVIFIIISIILFSLAGTTEWWFWILLTLGTTFLSIGAYWYLIEDSLKKNQKFEIEQIRSAILQAEAIGEARALGYLPPVTEVPTTINFSLQRYRPGL